MAEIISICDNYSLSGIRKNDGSVTYMFEGQHTFKVALQKNMLHSSVVDPVLKGGSNSITCAKLFLGPAALLPMTVVVGK